MMNYRKKPVEIQAVQWVSRTGTEVLAFCPIAEWVDDVIKIPTLEGIMNANRGDYIIKGIAGEYYPCKKDIFEATYEVV